MPYLRCDIFSNFNGLQYGAAGDHVDIIGDHGNVLIVQGHTGLRFPVKTKNLTETLTNISHAKVAPVIAGATRTHKKSKQISSTQTLF